MENSFEYESDFDSTTSENNEEEAHFHFILNDFEELIRKYGTEFVITKLRYPIYMQLYNYFEILE